MVWNRVRDAKNRDKRVSASFVPFFILRCGSERAKRTLYSRRSQAGDQQAESQNLSMRQWHGVKSDGCGAGTHRMAPRCLWFEVPLP